MKPLTRDLCKGLSKFVPSGARSSHPAYIGFAWWVENTMTVLEAIISIINNCLIMGHRSWSCKLRPHTMTYLKNTRTHSQTCVKLRESVIIDISCLDFRLHSPLGFIPEHHAALKKKEKGKANTHTQFFFWSSKWVDWWVVGEARGRS